MAVLEILSATFNTLISNWTVVLLSLFLYVAWKFKNSRLYQYYNRKYPPGPTFIPLIGYVPGLIRESLNGSYWAQLSEVHNSRIISIRFFGGIALMLNDYDMVKEYFVRRSNLSDRQDISFTTVCDPDYKGLVATSGHEWKAHRRFTMRIMRDLGMGKLMGEDNICSESLKAIKAFKEAGKNGRLAFDPQNIANMAVSNIINSFVFGKQFAYDDERFVGTLHALNEWFRDIVNPKNMLVYFPLGKWLMKDFMARLQSLYGQVVKFVSEEIEEHERNFDGEVKDLIDAYLLEVRTTEDKDVFSSSQLRYLIMDLFLAGSETTFSSLRWFLLYMAAYPDIQEKIYKELKSVMGHRLPSMQDKRNTPYTEAVMCEMQRCSPLIPTTLSHANLTEEVEVEGYLLPPNTPVFGNIYQIHYDPRYWKNPNEFDPNNFLDEEGNFVSSEKLIPFAIGEALARMELYVFFASWVRHFQIKPETDDTKPEIKFQVDGLNVPKPFKIRMIPRDDI